MIPLERQVAEKLHSYTRMYEGGGSTRARDIVDLQLIREHERLDPVVLRDAIQRVFDRRAAHDVPRRLPAPSRELAVGYRREAKHVNVVSGLDEAHRLLAEWPIGKPVVLVVIRGKERLEIEVAPAEAAHLRKGNR